MDTKKCGTYCNYALGLLGAPVWCLLDLQGLGSLDQKMKEVDRVTSGDEIIRSGLQSRSHFAAAVDWNLVAVQLFFCTGHRFAMFLFLAYVY